MSGREPDVEMRAAVKAKELRFEVIPQVEVTAHGDSPYTAESTSERENLPDGDLEPRATYRDFAVRWRATARLRDPEL